MEIIKQPWPWYIAGPLIGLIVPALLILGNKHFGISSSFRHICAACFPAKIPFFQYDWKKEGWNLFFVSGILIGAFIAARYMANPNPIKVSTELAEELNAYGITDYSNMIPMQLVNFGTLFTIKGFVMLVVGGFLVGFGTRYAGGCTSGHSITGLSELQPASLIATMAFMAGGFIMANLILPLIMTL